MIDTHYDVLGVHRQATASEIRAAYRDLARLMHPDRVGAGDREHVSMARLNEAYRVLGDPGRRMAYDRSLRAGADSTPPEVDYTEDMRRDFTPDDATRSPVSNLLSPSGPARVPWKLMLVLALLGSLLVLVSSIFDDSPADEVPDGILRSDSCVAFEPNGDVREVACTGADDVVVELLIPVDATCPSGMTGHRDKLGLGVACIES